MSGANVVASGERPRKEQLPRARRLALVVHRYVGLVIAVFLLVAGVTGSLLVFNSELDTALNPALMRVTPPSPGAPLLEPFVLAERIQAQLPAGQHHRSVNFDQNPGEAATTWLQVGPDKWRETFVNPYTGALLGSREWGDLFEGTTNLMPFLYRLHYSLALGDVGSLLFGIAALLWTIDCFVGAYLTFPTPQRASTKASAKVWLVRWLPAWLVRANKLFSFVFTWHRASGLWVWAMLFVFAWSAVGLNLSQVYQPVMGALTGMQKSGHDVLPQLEMPYPEPALTLREAYAVGRRLMAAEAVKRGFAVQREASLDYAADHGVFAYRVASSLDISKHPSTEVYFAGKDGRLVAFDAPTGTSAGNTVTHWLYGLHFAAVFGLWYRLFVVLMGLAVAMLSVSGVWIWWRKREKRVANAKRSTRRAPANELTPTSLPSASARAALHATSALENGETE